MERWNWIVCRQDLAESCPVEEFVEVTEGSLCFHSGLRMVDDDDINDTSSIPLLWLSSVSLSSLQCPIFCTFYCYIHANGSSDLLNCMLPHVPWPRCIRLSSSYRPCSIYLFTARVNQYSQSSFSGKLPAFVFPFSNDLNLFKREVERHLSPLLAVSLICKGTSK